MTTTYTAHDVLAGAYRGRNLNARALLTHASIDDGDSALCGRTGNLCDVASGVVNCPECLARIARRNLTAR